MNLTWFEFLIAALCTYRLSLLFSKEYGPLGIFEKLRNAPAKKSETKKWLECIFCFSMTASAFVCLLLWLAGTRTHYASWFMIWCALSSVAILVHMKFNNQEP